MTPPGGLGRLRTLFDLLLAIMMRLAQRLPIGARPEQAHFTTMRDDVIDHCRHRDARLSAALNAQRMAAQPRESRTAPLVAVPPLCCRAAHRCCHQCRHARSRTRCRAERRNMLHAITRSRIIAASHRPHWPTGLHPLAHVQTPDTETPGKAKTLPGACVALLRKWLEVRGAVQAPSSSL